MQASGVLPRQGLTIIAAPIANDVGHIVTNIASPVINARRIFLNDFKLQTANNVFPTLIQVAFNPSNGGLTTTDLQTPSSIWIMPSFAVVNALNEFRESWSFPGLSFAEVSGRNVPVRSLDIKLYDQTGALIPFLWAGIRFSVEYETTPNNKTDTAYTYPSLPVSVPQPIGTTNRPYWAGGVAQPY